MPAASPSSRVLVWLIGLSVIANAAAAALTFFVPDLLLGPAVMNGSARGTAIIMLVLGAPLLLASLVLGRSGSRWALVLRIGILAYLAYNGVMLLFATPLNRLFLVYVVAMSSTVFALGTSLVQAHPQAVAWRLRRMPARVIGGYILTIVVLNTLLWLKTVLPAAFAADPNAFLDGTGIATNPIFVQDLVFWLPSAGLIGWLAWTRRPMGALLAGAYLVYGLVESIGVATDQWLGSSADPGSQVATMGGAVIFVVMAVISLVALAFYAWVGHDESVAEAQAHAAPIPG